ncbi:MAG: hypothetical protein KGH63_04675 [Candidatus Micrarchaeota archaeon]|nr:hypothetical protein [Candidatus Micrarchaeota archaeon]
MDGPEDARKPEAAPARAADAPGPLAPSPAPAAPSLRAQIGEAEYAERLQSKLREYHFLITKEAAAHLLELEASGPQLRAQTLRAALLSPLPAMVRARVERIFPPKTFERGAAKGRIQRLSATDHSGPGTLVLYDAACQAIDEQVLSGDLVEAGPVRSRGGELHLSPGGTVRLLQKGLREKIIAEAAGRGTGGAGAAKAPSSIGNFEGIVAEFQGDFPVRKANWKQNTLGGAGAAGAAASRPPVGLMSSFTLQDDSGSARVVLWTSPGLAGQLRAGMRAQVENGIRRGGEIHVNEAGRVVFAHQTDGERKAPAIEKIEMDGNRVMVVAGSRELFFPSLEEACARLGAGKLPEGVSAQTIIGLKKAEWIGKPLPAAWEEKRN